jgi:hypothetical protein
MSTVVTYARVADSDFRAATEDGVLCSPRQIHHSRLAEAADSDNRARGTSPRARRRRCWSRRGAALSFNGVLGGAARRSGEPEPLPPSNCRWAIDEDAR